MVTIALLAVLASPPTDLTVVGAVVSAEGDRSTAVLRGSGQRRVVRVGERAFGGEVQAITAEEVVLAFDSGTVRLPLPAVQPGRRTAALPPRPAAPAAGALAFERKEVEARLNQEMPRILGETALRPVTQDGRIRGFALTRVPASATLLSEIGLVAGDVLTEVNGVAIDSLPTLMSLWPRLQTESELRATVMRNGTPVTLSVSLR